MLRLTCERGGKMAKKPNLKEKRIRIARKIENFADKLMAKEPKAIRNCREFVERHKIMVLVTFVAFVMVAMGSIWIVNYNTAYEYAYNGKTLGVVKSKEDVLKITDLVQEALTADKDVEVVIDDKEDITFKRVAIIGSDIHVDSSEDVLRRLTYVRNINVKGYCIAVNGEAAAIVDSKKTANAVLNSIKAGYTDDDENVVVEKAGFAEDIQIDEVNTDLENLQSKKSAKNKLLTGKTITSSYTVKKGDTLSSVADDYDVTEKEIMAHNPDINRKKLEVGSELTIVTSGSMVTYESTELVTYTEKIDYEVVEEKTDEMYEGDEDVQQKGKKGSRLVTAKVQKVNGKTSTKTPVVEVVEKKPKKEVVLVGTAERPPTIGDGKFRIPVDGTYRVSSEFGWRWGRNHNGLDMACSVGTNIVAADGGTVTWAGYKGTFGNLVIIDHQNGYETYYAHNSKLLVKAGDKVYEGQHIAESGNTGRSTGPHCHFEIRVNGTPKNPRGWINP